MLNAIFRAVLIRKNNPGKLVVLDEELAERAAKSVNDQFGGFFVALFLKPAEVDFIQFARSDRATRSVAATKFLCCGERMLEPTFLVAAKRPAGFGNAINRLD